MDSTREKTIYPTKNVNENTAQNIYTAPDIIRPTRILRIVVLLVYSYFCFFFFVRSVADVQTWTNANSNTESDNRPWPIIAVRTPFRARRLRCPEILREPRRRNACADVVGPLLRQWETPITTAVLWRPLSGAPWTWTIALDRTWNVPTAALVWTWSEGTRARVPSALQVSENCRAPTA